MTSFETQITYYCTIELGLGQDAPADRKPILPVADIKGRDGRMVGHLAEEKRETFEPNAEREMPTGMCSLLHIFHTRNESCPVH